MKREIRVALVGNPNVGKTAIMNALAGTNEMVGNWPGVTVQKKTGRYHFRGFDIELIDLPGIYSLTSYSLEERVTRNFLLSSDYDVVANVIDATLLGRNLYLTLELLDMGIKPVIALNKIDELKKLKFSIDKRKLSKILKLPVVSVSAAKREGFNDLSEIFLQMATGDIKPEGFTPVYSEFLEEAIDLLKLKIENQVDSNFPYNLRWFAIKLLEKDPEILKIAEKYLKDSKTILEEVEQIEKEVKERFGLDLPTFVSKERFLLASKIAKEVVGSSSPAESETLSDKIDRVITNPITGIPIFFFIMWLVFKLTFAFSQPFTELIDRIFSNWLPELVKTYLSFLPEPLLSLINDGILGGVGAVVVFLPILGILYFLMSILEDSGYMARAAALWDNFVKVFGLSGASVIPMILGFGCNVPAVYATRAMRSPFQKLVTMAAIPWMSCSARLTVYTVFVAAFFKERQATVIMGLYLLGIVLALLLAFFMSKFVYKQEEDEFFIELPSYKLPSWNVVFNETWIEVKDFLYRAGTIIFAVSVLVWALASLPPGAKYAGENSLIGHVGKALTPLFHPIGIYDWKPVVGLILGALAKEVVIGTLGTLYGTGESGLVEVLRSVFTPESALAFLVFTLLYTPCAATMAAIRQESNSWKFTLGVIAIDLTMAWILAFITYHVAKVLL